MAKKIIFLLVIVLGLLIFLQNIKLDFNAASDGQVVEWRIADKKLKVELATSVASIEKGLGNRESLANADGMLFIFDQPVKPIFWMKDMQFAIDLYWLRNGKIIGVEKNMPFPENETTELHRYLAPDYVDMVLEIPVSKNIDFYSE